VLPSWALAGNLPDVIWRLNGTAKPQVVPSLDIQTNNAILGGTELLERIKDEVCVRGSDGYHGVPVDWNAIVIAGTGSERGKKDSIVRSLVGKSVTEAARGFANSPPASLPETSKGADLGILQIVDTRSLGDPWMLFLYTLILDDLGTTVVLHVGHEDNVRKIMKHPRHMMCTDGLLAPKRPHPRVWASAGRYIGWYGRDLYQNNDGDGAILGPDGNPERPISEDYPAPFREVDSLEDVISHLTSRPAARLGLLFDPNTATSKSTVASAARPRVPRGLIAPGYAADLVLFDPTTIRDKATFANPNVPCSGIEWVLVNGKVAVEKGKVTGFRGGRTIRRDKATGLVW
jgi:N-acyl-D-amino-acid deacylase